MRTVLVGVRGVLGQNLLEMAPTEDEEPIEALSADGPDEALRNAFARGDRIGVLMVLTPSVRKTSSKPEVNLVSRSRMRNLTDRERSVRSWLRLRACWMTHSPAGLVVTPDR